jgi:hypothetical protein
VKSLRRNPDRPAIIYGADALAVLSLVWSGYAITDLMHSGLFGLSVAVAGDIGWITVLWAEYRGVTIAGKTWAAPVAGWLIAVAVGVLLVLHGVEHSRAQAIAGPFVVLVGKTVWTFALAAMKDPAALTPEQQAEIHDVMRSSSYTAQLHDAGIQQLNLATDAEIARIKAEARTVLARDDADFEIGLERQKKRAELQRRTPLALSPAPAAEHFDTAAEQAIEVVAEHDREQPSTTANTIASNPNTIRDQIANNAATSTNSDREPASIAELVREHVANTPNNTEAIRAVMAARPDANKDSVGAAVRRERRKQGPYL